VTIPISAGLVAVLFLRHDIGLRSKQGCKSSSGIFIYVFVRSTLRRELLDLLGMQFDSHFNLAKNLYPEEIFADFA
jgi:hypothetical protein